MHFNVIPAFICTDLYTYAIFMMAITNYVSQYCIWRWKTNIILHGNYPIYTVTIKIIPHGSIIIVPLKVMISPTY